MPFIAVSYCFFGINDINVFFGEGNAIATLYVIARNEAISCFTERTCIVRNCFVPYNDMGIDTVTTSPSIPP
jgi:hypothetical protein